MKEKILELRSQGYTYKQIIDALGCSKGTIAYHCGQGVKDKQVARQRDKRNQRVKFLQQYKQERGCQDCGEMYPYYMLDFDHLRDKKFGIGTSGNHPGMEKLLEEVEKCEVVCANCHRIRTYNRLLKSGGDTMDLTEHY